MAQPNLTLSSMQPAVGQVFETLTSAELPPGNSGPNQVYDMSAATAGSGLTFTMVQPNTAPGATNFPAANACSDNDGLSYTFQQYTGQGAFELGMEIPGNGRTVYTNAIQYHKFPLAFNTNWTDSYQGNTDFMGSTGTITGTLSAVADGYGTLVLPWGTVTDVLRLRVERDETAVVMGITTETNLLFHYYLKAGVPMPVAQRLIRTVTGPGGTQQVGSLTYLTENSMQVGLAETEAGIRVGLFPVPAHDRLHVSLSDGAIASIRVNDVTGRELPVPLPTPGARELVLDVSAWAGGTYLVRVLDSNGRAAVRTIAVH